MSVRTTRRIVPLLAGAALALGCGSSVQRARVVPVSAPAARPELTRGLARRYSVQTARSRFSVYGEGVLTGSHRLSFTRWRAHVIAAERVAIHLDVETASVQAAAPFLTSFARDELLEADRFPRATLEATLRVVDERDGTVAVDGVADIHGVRRGLRFDGTLERRGDELRFRAEFVMSRAAFAIRARPSVDRFIKDDVRVVVDAVATPDEGDARPAAP